MYFGYFKDINNNKSVQIKYIYYEFLLTKVNFEQNVSYIKFNIDFSLINRSKK